jgi:hypothetical protein
MKVKKRSTGKLREVMKLKAEFNVLGSIPVVKHFIINPAKIDAQKGVGRTSKNF